MTPGGWEVTGPRTPESLHPAPPATSSPCSNTSWIEIFNWRRRYELQCGERARRPPGTASAKKAVLCHEATPSSTAGEVEHHQQNPTPTRHRLQDAAGKGPTRAYTMYTQGNGVPPPSRRRSGRRREGNRRFAGGEVVLLGNRKKITLTVAGRGKRPRLALAQVL